MSHNKGSILGATFLVAGTCIGGGMLALPVVTGVLGFLPSIFFMLVGWAFMTTTALLLAEANLWMEEGVHVITLASRLLGPLAQGVAWLLYLFIGYASLVAYSACGSELFIIGIQTLIGVTLSQTWAVVLFVLLFGTIVYLGNVIVGRVNTFLMMGLIISYLLLIMLGMPHIKGHFLLRGSLDKAMTALPLLLTIFSFQTIVPSLTIYLKQDGRALRMSIILGTTIALAVYGIWQAIVLGIIPVEGERGLAAALEQGKSVTEFLRFSITSSWLVMITHFFAFFAIVTSFLGIALGLFDFLADGLRIKEEKWGNVALGLLIAIPTIFFTLGIEGVFLCALDMSGGFGDAILNGLFPALMVWVGRYRKNLISEHRTFGGKPLLVLVICYALFIFMVELLSKLGVLVV